MGSCRMHQLKKQPAHLVHVIYVDDGGCHDLGHLEHLQVTASSASPDLQNNALPKHLNHARLAPFVLSEAAVHLHVGKPGKALTVACTGL